MELHLSPEHEAHLARIAQHEGRPLEELVNDAVMSLLSEDDAYLAAVRLGLAQANAGSFIEEDEMHSRFETMLLSQ